VDITLAADAILEQLVLYAPLGATFFAVEPWTNANDGFNLLANGIRGSGIFVLQPGEERSAAFTLRSAIDRGAELHAGWRGTSTSPKPPALTGTVELGGWKRSPLFIAARGLP